MNQLNIRWLIERTFAEINQPKVKRIAFFQLTFRLSTIIMVKLIMVGYYKNVTKAYPVIVIEGCNKRLTCKRYLPMKDYIKHVINIKRHINKSY